MNPSLPLVFAHTQQLASSRYNINKPRIVLITSVIATILGLAVLAANIALLVLFGALGSTVFNGIIIGIILGVMLLLFLGGIHVAIIFKLARSRRLEISRSESIFRDLQTRLQDLQNRLSEKEGDIRILRSQLNGEAIKIQELLKIKQEELDSLTRRYAAMAQENSSLAELVSRLRGELAELRRVLKENQASSDAIIERCRINSELLHSESVIAWQSQEAEKVIAERLRSSSKQLQTQLREKEQILRSKEQMIDKLTRQVSELKREVSGLQIFITDNVANREPKRGVVDELKEKLIALKAKIENLQGYITESTDRNNIEIPTGAVLIERANILCTDVSDIQEFMAENIIVQPSDDAEDQN
ncbi:Membrane-bound metallopeptidase,chromosome segregation protein SMC,IncA protein [Chlamydia poikilotherma]|uniref:Membrane-bound metallopeptidase,chromosome segregation protein SMC,IncA protein n=1 Tax=Chlamydia poikilotherma TaxID=1967783 RepID=A0A3B0PN74_9CHLA|nr:IncA family protein [Chlamydia poikilotherma]SYX09259.1 Membrane-bound metallopeptidase,chromosome segregation protein SMC,IncA protein [Chlamydia poikilotherma]